MRKLEPVYKRLRFNRAPAHAAGIASDHLAGAAQHARACAERRGNMGAAWALLGDALLEHHAVTPQCPSGTEPLQQYAISQPCAGSAARGCPVFLPCRTASICTVDYPSENHGQVMRPYHI